MSDFVACAECGTRYDSDENPFCPRCGSTARGKAVPGAIVDAQRRAPARRRVQASGVLLAAIGLLFLASSVTSLLALQGDVPASFSELMQDQAGGSVTIVPADGQPFTANVTTLAGVPVANVTAHVGNWTFAADKAVVRIEAAAGNASYAGTVIAIAGDRVAVALADLDGERPVVGPVMRSLARAALAGSFAMSLLLVAGGLAALLLRWWPLAATAAVVAALLGVMALFVLLVGGLLFAVPFGFAAVFILRGRRQFRRPAKGPAPPAGRP